MRAAGKKEEEFNIKIGCNLRISRENVRKSQKEIAEHLGVTINHISGLENGGARTTAYELVEYCSVTGADPSAVMGLEQKTATTEELILRQVKLLSKEEKQMLLRILKAINTDQHKR